MNVLYEYCTGFGKSKKALDSLPKVGKGQWNLIVVPKLVLIDNWKKEIIKWGYDVKDFEFVTYNSIHKKTLTFYKSAIYDECHHITDRVKQYLEVMHTENNFFLSATVKRDLKFYLQMKFNVKIYEKGLSDAIDEGRLPEPEIILIPLQLGNVEAKYPIKKKWQGKEYTKMCTQRGVIDDMEGLIKWFKGKVDEGKSNLRFKWLAACLERNKQLSRFKEEYTVRILTALELKRTLTFCCDIEQSNRLGFYSINSKNRQSEKALKEFNNGDIDHITAVSCLNEGINLQDCEFSVFNFLNSSEVVVRQKNGRGLRHKTPKFIVPYFEFTREDELVKKIIADFNPESVKKMSLTMFEEKYGD